MEQSTDKVKLTPEEIKREFLAYRKSNVDPILETRRKANREAQAREASANAEVVNAQIAEATGDLAVTQLVSLPEDGQNYIGGRTRNL
ncbi:MAG: hypothetical protein M3Q14_02415 [bacterium]|nr:hypothetical protein [bacterium]